MSQIGIYSLQLHDPSGASATGTLTLVFPEGSRVADIGAARKLTRSAADEDLVQIGITNLTAMISATMLPAEFPLAGIEFSDYWYGPPYATVLTGTQSGSQISLSFNLIDSPGHYIGGALTWRPEGSSGESHAWAFIGVIKS